ncbi:uncharacterized protein UMAG_11940 [Mycosarcoma maydis]|uniref:Late effector protein 1 n=1 Tax=Mycosarcoma maydis TaxID=5270 RepID=LEP1_MYCMD|nr:uncharacterized protein UMAG_11940 [Ustilago maydis 521]KIS69032.1 hypothetical protein UMAG_11940 [Ustilago maydis 521]|eukprot:XP_011389566.1 hypothetical protein UMAG_11940 [Ustilago maydis 521]
MRSHQMAAFFAVSLMMMVVLGALSAPIPSPRPIEDIYPSQLPDAGTAQIVAGDSGILPTLLAVGFDPNDRSVLKPVKNSMTQRNTA